MVRLSVVIPTYERPEFLKGAIDSAVEQTFDDIEVVVVDDGSRGDYATEVTGRFPEHVRCIVHGENQGLSAARNTGLEHARGKYIAFLDDDDRWRHDKLELQVKALEANPLTGFATCRLAAIDSDGNLLRCDGEVVSGDISNEILTRNIIGTPSRVVVRQDALPGKRPFDNNISSTQDWDLFIRVCQDWEVAGVNEVLCYRTRHGGMSSDPGEAKTDNMRVIEKHRELIERRGLWSKTMAEYHRKVGVTYLLDGQRKLAREELWESVRLEFRPETVAMLLLTFGNQWTFRRALSIKRWYERATRDCGSVSVRNRTIDNP